MPSPDVIFSAGNTLALAGWAILVFLPRRYRAIFWIPQFVIPALLALAYCGLMGANFFRVEGGGFGSIGEVRALFASDAVLVAGWLHYLAFDLFVGAWIARQSDAAGIPRLVQTVFLVATFMFGPAGLFLFLLTRTMAAGLVKKKAP